MMDRNDQKTTTPPPYPENGPAYHPPYPSQKQHLNDGVTSSSSSSSPYQPDPAHSAMRPPETSSVQDHRYSPDAHLINQFESSHPHPNYPVEGQSKRWNKKQLQRLYWIVPLAILGIVLSVLFEVYKSDFERWVHPLTEWLRKRESWSWVIPVAILFILSFPPLFGHEIVQLVVGLTYPLGVAMGIACAGAVLGEAGCFVVFKYGFTQYVDKKIATKVRWAAIARITQEAGYRGVLVIRYSIVPPHLANPLFACTGMKFWIYMTTVILSLPKSIVFVVLGTPSSENSKAAKYAKVIAILVLVAVTIFASRWMRTKLAIATKEIEAERGIYQANEQLDTWNHAGQNMHTTGAGDTSYHGADTTPPMPYPNPYPNAGVIENRP